MTLLSSEADMMGSTSGGCKGNDVHTSIVEEHEIFNLACRQCHCYKLHCRHQEQVFQQIHGK